MGNRDAAKVGANPDHDQPLIVAFLDPRLVGLRIGKAGDVDLARLVDLLLGAVADIDRLAAPEQLDVLAFGDRRQIDIDRRAGRDGRGIRIHLRNKRPEGRRPADRGGSSRCDKEEITACRMFRRRRCRHDSKPFLSCSRWNRPPANAYTNAYTTRRRLPAPATGAAERPLFPTQSGGTSSPESFYWHPCRKSASPLSAGPRAM